MLKLFYYIKSCMHFKKQAKVKNIDNGGRGDAHHRGSILDSCPAAPGMITSVPDFFQRNFIYAS